MKKLQKGMHIRVLSPSSSIERVGGFEANRAAKERLEELGFRVSYSKHYFEHDFEYLILQVFKVVWKIYMMHF